MRGGEGVGRRGGGNGVNRIVARVAKRSQLVQDENNNPMAGGNPIAIKTLWQPYGNNNPVAPRGEGEGAGRP